jgi:hypothetical protein
MTPKQKAVDLFNDYYSYLKANLMYDEEARLDAKVCALIAVEFAREFITGDLNESFDKTMYLFEVKQEIEKL